MFDDKTKSTALGILVAVLTVVIDYLNIARWQTSQIVMSVIFSILLITAVVLTFVGKQEFRDNAKGFLRGFLFTIISLVILIFFAAFIAFILEGISGGVAPDPSPIMVW